MIAESLTYKYSANKVVSSRLEGQVAGGEGQTPRVRGAPSVGPPF